MDGGVHDITPLRDAARALKRIHRPDASGGASTVATGASEPDQIWIVFASPLAVAPLEPDEKL